MSRRSFERYCREHNTHNTRDGEGGASERGEELLEAGWEAAGHEVVDGGRRSLERYCRDQG